MKQLIYAVMSLLLLISCNRDDGGTVNPVDQLPPLTTEGKNTFGCLINGEVFTPRGATGSDGVGSYYQYGYNNGNPKYYFQVYGDNNRTNESVSLSLKLDEFEDLRAEETYILSNINNGGQGTYINVVDDYDTDLEHTGTLTITHYDYDNRIVSGTFEFEVNVEGEIYKITDGRFDLKFTI